MSPDGNEIGGALNPGATFGVAGRTSRKPESTDKPLPAVPAVPSGPAAPAAELEPVAGEPPALVPELVPGVALVPVPMPVPELGAALAPALGAEVEPVAGLGLAPALGSALPPIVGAGRALAIGPGALVAGDADAGTSVACATTLACVS